MIRIKAKGKQQVLAYFYQFLKINEMVEASGIVVMMSCVRNRLDRKDRKLSSH